MTVDSNNEQSLLDGIKRYAAFDKSDPFTLARCLCHLRQGLCKRTFLQNGEPYEGHYDAEVLSGYSENAITVTYKNVRRP